MNIDLNIDNYNLEDILHLFKIPQYFDENHMKQAKQIVLKTHPDKSQLPAEYFIFYSKAYKVLYSIWEFRKKGDVNSENKNTEYTTLKDEEKEVLLNDFFESNKKFKNVKNFNQWFNKEFEKNRLQNEQQEKGYGDWLKTEEENEEAIQMSGSSMKEEFDRKKREARSLVVRQDVQDIFLFQSSSGADLDLNAPKDYNSGLFSSLAYQDLYQAHTETVIPVTDEDYENVRKFGSVDEYKRHRDVEKRNMKPLSEMEAKQFLSQKSQKEEEQSVRRAYELAKQSEIAKQKNQEFWSHIQLLKNK
jgi:hypothetical protein